jgi:hypothetical protein
MKAPSYKSTIIFTCFAMILSLASAASAKGEVEGDVIVMPSHWHIPEGRAYGKVLLAWQITNLDERYIRFRKRDLGFVKILDSNLNVIKPVMLGVDATRGFQESDYPLIGPNETIYLPFVITFKKNVSGSYSIKVRSNSDGDEGWIYDNLKEGEYTLVVSYSAMQLDQKNSLSWELEMKYAREKYLNSFWKGEITSDEVKFTIAGDG